MPIITSQHLSKFFMQGNSQIWALKDISFSIHQGEFVAITGRSGSGKTTLLNLIAGNMRPSGGSVYIENCDIANAGDAALSMMRRKKIGFIYQNFDLIPYLTVRENILLPLILDRKKIDEAYFSSLCQTLGIAGRLKHFPSQLSGGEQQRMAMARALVKRPAVLLADEPTGNLDRENADAIMQLLMTLHRQGVTILLVTHDERYAACAGRILHISDGRILPAAV